MAQVNVQITLEGGEIADGWRQYRPGEEVSGTARITPATDIQCNHVTIRAGWHTEGRGDRDGGSAGELDVFQGTLAAGETRAWPFRFTLPREPWSYAGHYVNVVWEVSVDFDVPMARDLHFNERIILAPAPRQ